jgi:asparaginyl-tRNA synthetase
MAEIEMTFANLTQIINLAEKMLKYVINYVLENSLNELEFFENYESENKKEIISKLKKNVDGKFKKINYDETIKILEKNKKNFVFNDIK